ncbi:MAG: metallophosphoesterase family protein [Fibrobacterota bacterium]
MRYRIKLLNIIIFSAVFYFTVFTPEIGAVEYVPDKNTFYFVQITDTHLGNKHNNTRAEKIVRDINKIPFKIEFTVITGDIMADNILDKKAVRNALEIFRELKNEVIFLPGNHDILFNEYKKDYEKTSSAYRENFGPLNQHKEIRGVNFIFLYTEAFKYPELTEFENPLQYTDSVLNIVQEAPSIILHHRPVSKDYYNSKVHPGTSSEIRKKWYSFLNRHNVKAVITGHFHRDEMHMAGDIPVFVCPPSAPYFGRQSAYRIYEYRNGQISYTTQYIK